MNSNDDVSLLARYLSHQLNAAEMAAVEVRLMEDEEFWELAEPMIKVWTMPGSLRPRRKRLAWEWKALVAAGLLVVVGVNGGLTWLLYGYMVLMQPFAPDRARNGLTTVRTEPLVAPDFAVGAKRTITSGEVLVAGTDTLTLLLDDKTAVRLHPGARFETQGPIMGLHISWGMNLSAGAADVAVPDGIEPPELNSPTGTLVMGPGNYRLRCERRCEALVVAVDDGKILMPNKMRTATGRRYMISGDSIRVTKGNLEWLGPPPRYYIDDGGRP